MKTDHELLALAAKAVGGEWSDYPDKTPDHWIIKKGGCFEEWNPLIDDGDCARMEATLGLDVVWYEIEVSSGNDECSRFIQYSDHAGDKQAARRMASLRAAAEIGKEMP